MENNENSNTFKDKVHKAFFSQALLNDSEKIKVPTNTILLFLGLFMILFAIIIVFFGLKDLSIASFIASDLCFVALLIKVKKFGDLE